MASISTDLELKNEYRATKEKHAIGSPHHARHRILQK
jgi:hypothetical protein